MKISMQERITVVFELAKWINSGHYKQDVKDALTGLFHVYSGHCFKWWPVSKFQQVYTRYVSEVRPVESMLEQEILTEKELEIYKRGRNTNRYTKVKMDVVTYRMSVLRVNWISP